MKFLNAIKKIFNKYHIRIIFIILSGLASCGCYIAYFHQIKPFDISFFLFFLILMIILILSIIIQIISQYKHSKILEKNKIRDENELKIKEEKAKLGEIYLTTRDKEKLSEIYLREFRNVRTDEVCPVCKTKLQYNKSTTMSSKYVDHIHIPGVYVATSEFGRVTEAYRSGSEMVACPCITIKCPKCEYTISYTNGFKTEDKEEWHDNERRIVKYNVPTTIRSVSWGKLKNIMQTPKNPK